MTTLDSLANAAASFSRMTTAVPLDYESLIATGIQSSTANPFMPPVTFEFDTQCDGSESIVPVTLPANLQQFSRPPDILPQTPSNAQTYQRSSSYNANHGPSVLQPDPGLLSPTEGSFEDVGLSSNELNNWEYHDPDPSTAWKYTSAYFQYALDASMGVVQRSTFETQLTSYLNGVTSHVDVAWHALRNAIYASGCRIHLSETQSFQEANRVAWTYFENALAFYAQILLFRTSLTSVQALTVMAYYSQNFGSPCLEYMLCNNALALAVGRGLHRKPTQGWNLTPAERSHRSCIFWALYCLEKQIEKQSGRPSVSIESPNAAESAWADAIDQTINDDEVTCELPEPSLVPNESLNLTYLTLLAKLSRFASLVTRQLSSVRVMRLGAQELVTLVVKLDEQLAALRSSLEPTIMLGGAMNPNRLPPGITLQQAVYLHCFYHTTLLDIHSTLIHPWSKSLLGLTPHRVLRSQVETSVETVLRACHTAMLTLNYVHIDAATPVPLSFVAPICVLTNLFICILQNPGHQQVARALSLMELGTAFFTRLHVASDSAVPMEFAKELTALARETSQNFNLRASPLNRGTDGSESRNLSTVPVTTADPPCDYHTPDFVFPDDSREVINREELDLLEFEQWSILIPADIDLDGIDFPMPVGTN
ncbi:hypothetical protein LTR84_000681 [Exophiala bonariae]|uniref:Xylanolytic transcriptional activator regulatory domain-containing protein n=1 Tax=Exophiala bonariae TaxID=1690606 RepID=A0AAV9NU12_9EURO|nr:hypothetical protein LTR84_000681 [Exophiala bonariae]